MKIRYLSFVAIILINTVAQAVFADEVLTVDDAVRIALDNNLSLKRSSLDVQTRKRTADNSWNSLLPSISAGGMISHPTSIIGPIEPVSRDVWTPGCVFRLHMNTNYETLEQENGNI